MPIHNYQCLFIRLNVKVFIRGRNVKDIRKKFFQKQNKTNTENCWNYFQFRNIFFIHLFMYFTCYIHQHQSISFHLTLVHSALFFCRISFDAGSTIQNMNAYWQHNRAITSKFYSAFTVAGPSVLPRWMFREWFCSWIHASSSEYTRRTCGLWTAAWMIHRVRSVQLRLRYRQILYFVCVDLS